MITFPRDLVVIDTETTGLKPATNHIIQLSAVKLDKELLCERNRFDVYVIPPGDWSIEPSAQEVHGYTKEFILEHGIPLADAAKDFVKFIDGCDFLTYNGNKFDIPFICSDFALVGQDISIRDRVLWDSFLIEKILNAHTLEATYIRYTGDEGTCAHNSMCDVLMTAEVFRRQIANTSEEALREAGLNTAMVFPEAILDLNEDQEPYFTGGKHSDELVKDVIRKDPSYIQWLFNNVLTRGTKDYLIERFSNTNASKSNKHAK